MHPYLTHSFLPTQLLYTPFETLLPPRLWCTKIVLFLSADAFGVLCHRSMLDMLCMCCVEDIFSVWNVSYASIYCNEWHRPCLPVIWGRNSLEYPAASFTGVFWVSSLLVSCCLLLGFLVLPTLIYVQLCPNADSVFFLLGWFAMPDLF